MKTHPGGDRPKVLLVAPQPFYEDRGTPIAVRHVLEALAQLGLESHLLTFPVGKPVEIPGLRITRCANPFGIRSVPVGLSVRKVLLDLTLLAVLRRELRRHDYACIHAVEEMVLPALLLSRRIGVPVVYDMQSSIPEQLLDHWCLGRRPFQAALRRGEKWTIANADFVVSSTGLAERVHASCVSSKHREWVFPGPDFVAHATMTDRVRARLGLPSDQPLIVFAGTFERYQGINLLLKAIPMVLEVQPDVLFVLVGSRDEKDARLPEDHALPANAVRVIQRQPRESTCCATWPCAGWPTFWYPRESRAATFPSRYSTTWPMAALSSPLMCRLIEACSISTRPSLWSPAQPLSPKESFGPSEIPRWPHPCALPPLSSVRRILGGLGLCSPSARFTRLWVSPGRCRRLRSRLGPPERAICRRAMNGQSADSEIGRGAGQRPLRVLHVVDKLSTGGSPVHGLTRLLSWWLPLYDPRRVRASVGCLRGPQDGHATLACAGIAVRYLGRSKFDARTIPRLVRNLRSERIDILHLHGFGGSTIGRLVGWITGIPCIVHEHVCKAEIPTHQRLADRLLRSRTAAAIAASGAVADFLAEKRFIPPDAIQVVHGGVPARLFRAPAKRGWRRKLGVAEDCRIVATVGRLHAAKGHTHFLEAARQVLDAVERVVFLIVGDGELLDELRQQAASLDLEKHVLFT